MPTLYGGDTFDAALSESLLRGVPLDGPRRQVLATSVSDLVVSRLEPRRQLRLAALHGHGLRRLRTTRRDLIETGPRDYARTASWAQRLYDGPQRLDGLIWRSRQNDDVSALILFGSRVGPDLRVDLDAEPLDTEPWHSQLLSVLDQADIALVA